MLSLLVVSLACIAIVFASPVNETSGLNAPRKIGKRCTGIIQSLADVAAAQECLTINVSSLHRVGTLMTLDEQIGGFTVPAGSTFALAPPDGAVVSLTGQITFAFKVNFFLLKSTNYSHEFG